MHQHYVDHGGARLGDFHARLARVVVHPDHRAFQSQEGLAGGQPLGGRDLAGKVEALTRMLMEATDHEEEGKREAEICNRRKAGMRPDFGACISLSFTMPARRV